MINLERLILLHFPVPVKIILTYNSNTILPAFYNNEPSVLYVPYYAFIGSYIATMIAFDPVQRQLVNNYAIQTQPTNLNTMRPYFSIDTLNGLYRFFKDNI